MNTVAEALTSRQRVGRWVRPRLPMSRSLFDQLRLETAAAWSRAAYAVFPWRWNRLRAVRVAREQWLNVACGPHVADGFLNLDLLPGCRQVMEWDCRRSLPAADGGAAGIRVEHFVEHLDPRDELPAFLADCHRALRAGGVLRLVVPDAERFLRAYCRGDLQGFRDLAVPEPFPGDLPTRMDVVNHVFHQWHEHRWAYDFETLDHRLRAAGFAQVDRSAFAQSLEPRLACDRPAHAPYSLYVDAVK
ncbi:MAG: class I SAM-dependent methyltransferase [Vicinamibacterales bacterium]